MMIEVGTVLLFAFCGLLPGEAVAAGLAGTTRLIFPAPPRPPVRYENTRVLESSLYMPFDGNQKS
jgi:hypothetical protein